MTWENLRLIGGLTGAFITGLWVSAGTAVQMLIVLMALDMATGMIVAAMGGKLASDVAWRGVCRKVLTLGILGTVAALATIGGTWPAPYHTVFDFAPQAVAGFYCAVEALSIIENAVEGGIPVPTFLKKALAILRDATNGDDLRSPRRDGDGTTRNNTSQ